MSGKTIWQPMDTAPDEEVIFCRDANQWPVAMIMHVVPARTERGPWPWSKVRTVEGYRTLSFAIPTDSGGCYALAMRADYPWTPVEWAWPFFDPPPPDTGERV